MDDDELRELMKENGIGRPSTRANIIETLFRRRYIQKERKRLVATPTGVELIGSIENDLLKSAELTGQWERKLRQIENGELEIALFMEEMKQMVSEVINQVKSSPRRQITILEDEEKLKAKAKEEAKLQKQKEAAKAVEDISCPQCGNGKLLKGNSAWGCRITSYNVCYTKLLRVG